MKEQIDIKYITDDMYYTNRQISNSHIVYSDISQTAIKDKAKLHSLKFCVSGLEIYIINGYEKRLAPGEFILVNPEQNFEIIADKPNTQGICLFFENNDEYDLSNLIFENKKHRIEDNKSLLNQINYINNNIISNRKLQVKINFSSFIDIITNDERLSKHELNNLEMKNSYLSIDLAYRLVKVKEFIDDNFYEEIDIEKLACLSYTSKFHFLRMFKKMFGVSPYHYLLERRLVESKNLLKKHNTIEVSKLLKFSDRSAFSNKFKKRYSMNPSDYKNSL